MTGQADVNHDGYPDLVLYFRTQDLNLSSTSTEAVLYATTYSGQRIRGSDTVRIVPAGKGSSAGAGPAGHKPLPPPGARGSGVSGSAASGSANGSASSDTSGKTLPTGPRGGN
jgi:hypothetical protein